MSEVIDEHYEALLFFYSDELLVDFVTKYALELNSSPTISEPIFKIKKSPQLQNAILAIVPYFENETPQDKELLSLKFEEIFLNILNSSSKSLFTEFLSLVYSQEIAFKTQVEQEYLNFESISQMAESFKMSELNFRKKFKDAFETTPKKWILNKKLHKARTLLQHSSLNVTQVCHEVGFDNLSWFTQTFKKEFNITPSQLKTNKI